MKGADMEDVFLYVLKLNILAAAVILLALILSGFLRHRYSVWWRNRLWLLVAVLLLFPLPFPAAEHAFRIPVPDEIVLRSGQGAELSDPGGKKGEIISGTEALEASSEVLSEESSEKVFSKDTDPSGKTVALEWILRGAAAVWLAGVMLALGNRILGYRVVKKELGRWSMEEPDKELLLKCRKMSRDMGIRHPPRIFLNQKLTTPLLSGLFRPKIYLPSEQFTQRELELLLEHELCHYWRKDLWYQQLLQIVCIVYWWNPMLWVMKKQAQKELEFLCDEMVTKEKRKDERMQYNYLLARTAVRSRKFYGMSTGFSKDMSVLKERMVNVMKSGSRKKGSILTVCFIAVLLAANIMTGCSVKEKSDTDNKSTVQSESVSGESDPEQEPLSTEPVEAEKPEAAVTPESAVSDKKTTVTPEPTATPDRTETPKSTETQESTKNPETQETAPTPAAEPQEEQMTAVQAKINVYEGEYKQDRLYSGEPEMANDGYIVRISSITDTSFDFAIYHYKYTPETNEVADEMIFRTHTAIFVGDGETAVYDGKDYDLTFTFPNGHGAYPEATDMEISGFPPVEGADFSNNSIPGHEFS